MSEHLLTVDETCSRLHISRPTFYGLLRSGRLSSVKIGRARRVPASAVDDLIRELLDEPETAA